MTNGVATSGDAAVAATASQVRDALRPRRPRGLGLGALLAIGVHLLLVIGIALSLRWRSSEHGCRGNLRRCWPARAGCRWVRRQ